LLPASSQFSLVILVTIPTTFPFLHIACDTSRQGPHFKQNRVENYQCK
jgi:hypothetical protein